MSDMKTNVLDQWKELKTLVEANEIDVMKNANGNASAGVRARHGLRLLQKKAAELVKTTLAHDKNLKESKGS
jgi:hypothetical protein